MSLSNNPNAISNDPTGIVRHFRKVN
jgi:hypothetical protein